MNTNEHECFIFETTDHTDYTDFSLIASPPGRQQPKASIEIQDVECECYKRLRRLRRFITLCASENNVMRKLEIHSPLALGGCGGSSRFAQVKTTSCESLKSIVR